jgi:hypothetical protein
MNHSATKGSKAERGLVSICGWGSTCLHCRTEAESSDPYFIPLPLASDVLQVRFNEEVSIASLK